MSAIRTTQRGFSLVELMISVTIGLVILAGVLSLFLGAKQAFRTQEGLSQVQEGGRFIGYLMSPYVRMAGYLPDPLVQVNPADHFRGNWAPVSGTDNGFFPATRLTGVNAVKAGTDALLVSYGGGAPAVGTCRGGGVNDAQIVANVFYISAPDSAGLSALNCGTAVFSAGTGAALRSPASGPVVITNAQPLIGGVQDMQILYGIDTDTSDDGSAATGQSSLSPTRYVTAGGVTDWERVVSLRITLTIDGAERTEGGTDVGADTADVNDDRVKDGRVRRTFTTTLFIRNRLRA